MAAYDSNDKQTTAKIDGNKQGLRTNVTINVHEKRQQLRVINGDKLWLETIVSLQIIHQLFSINSSVIVNVCVSDCLGSAMQELLGHRSDDTEKYVKYSSVSAQLLLIVEFATPL